MAAKTTAVSFDDIIQADRQRRKNEALANDILGRGRKSNPVSIETRKFNTKPTFSSRVGVAKPSQRSSSSTSNKSNLQAAWTHDLHHARGVTVSRQARRETQPARIAQKERLHEAATDKPVLNGSINPTAITAQGDEINIRGRAGPCVVVGSNFAPGTTAADIESALMPSVGEMQSCKIVSYSPIVIAEMAFAEKANAQAVIANFNNKKADGRVLYVYMKQEYPNSAFSSPKHPAPNESRTSRGDLSRSDPPPPELSHQEALRSDSMRPEPITSTAVRPGTYDVQREQSDLNRRRAEPEIQDGSYGFESRDEHMDVDVDNHRNNWRNDPRENERSKNVIRGRDERRLYSDDLYPRQRGRVFR